MSVHKDNTMHAVTADEEFAALMAASSLRAPRVRALDEVIPDDARRQLRAAAEDLDTTGTDPGQAASELDEQPVALKGSDEGALSCPGDTHAGPASASWLVAYREALVSDNPQPIHAALWRNAPGFHGDTTRRGSFTIRAIAAQLCTPEPSGNSNSRLLARRLCDALPTDPAWHTTARTVLSFSTGSGKTAAFTAALLQWASPRDLAGNGSTPFLVITHLAGAGWLADAVPGPQSSPAHSSVWEPAATAVLSTDPCSMAMPARLRERRLAIHTETRSELSRLHLERAWALHRCVFELCDVRKEKNNSFSTVTAGLTTPGSTKNGEHHLKDTARLTDFLYRPQPSAFDRICQWLPGRLYSQLCDPRNGQLLYEEAPHCFLASLVDSARLAAQVRGLPPNAGKIVFSDTPSPGREERTNSPLDYACLLVAAGLAMDLNSVYRRAVPAQPPRLPDLDAYASRLGSTLMLPRRDADTETADRTCRKRVIVTVSEKIGKPRLWNRKDGEDFEQHAQLWMRLHLSEGDRGQRLPVRLAYRTADPYGVTAVFNHGTDEEREWVFARELLVDGMRRSAGIGDVIVWPGTDETSGQQRVFIRLRSPDGTALLSTARGNIAAFLAASQPLSEHATANPQTTALAALEHELAEIICPGTSE